MDFDGIITSKDIKKVLKERYFTQVTIKSHKDFFRVTLELDSYYEYVITEIDSGYILGVR